MKPLELIAAKFSQDYSSNAPEYNGYYPTEQENAPFKTPCFEREVVDLIIQEYTENAAKYPDAGYDALKWDGDILIWSQLDADEAEPVYPIKGSIEGKEITVYPVGLGSWNWEMGE